MKKYKQNYWLFGAVGTLLLGFGLCALLESGFLKHSEAPTWQWLAAGTCSLILIMSGINLLFESFKNKIKIDNKDE